MFIRLKVQKWSQWEAQQMAWTLTDRIVLWTSASSEQPSPGWRSKDGINWAFQYFIRGKREVIKKDQKINQNKFCPLIVISIINIVFHRISCDHRIYTMFPITALRVFIISLCLLLSLSSTVSTGISPSTPLVWPHYLIMTSDIFLHLLINLFLVAISGYLSMFLFPHNLPLSLLRHTLWFIWKDNRHHRPVFLSSFDLTTCYDNHYHRGIGGNITRILDAFFNSGYDKRVRPNYGGMMIIRLRLLPYPLSSNIKHLSPSSSCLVPHVTWELPVSHHILLLLLSFSFIWFLKSLSALFSSPSS